MSIKVSALFPLPTQETVDTLESYGKVISKAVPMRTRHFDELHYCIRDLSRMLNGDQADLTNDYMGDPRSLNAYLRYYLPWNLYRMTRLLSSLDLRLPDNGIVADLGAGPLTVAQALWIARPELRKKKLTIVNMDRTPKVMKEGQKIFHEMVGDCPWKIVNIKGGISTKLRERADLLVCANMINEIITNLRNPMAVWAEKFCLQLGKMLSKTGRLLLIEPGVRHCGRALSVMRNEFLENGWSPLAPCPHREECPMPGEHGTSWCHFNFDTRFAPQWLQDLSSRCGLEKDNVSLSFLYMAKPSEEDHVEDSSDLTVRAISGSFRLDSGGYGQYGCSEKGLILLQAKGDAHCLFPGGLITMPDPESEEHDEKSGALIVDLPVRSAASNKKSGYTAKKPVAGQNRAEHPKGKFSDHHGDDKQSQSKDDSEKSEKKDYRKKPYRNSNNDNEGWSSSRKDAFKDSRRDSHGRGGKRKG